MSMTLKINFVHRDIAAWEDVASPSGVRLSLADLAPRLLMAREVWGVQAFHMLRQKGLPVHLSGDLRPDAINIAHCTDLADVADTTKYFVVSIRADRDPNFWAHLEIVQNQSSVWRKSDIYLPHWPQPGLVERDASRGARVENLVFIGRSEHLAEEFKSDAFSGDLRRLGVVLRLQETSWWDYRQADVVLAVRTGTPFYLSIKPASKLVNAWHAGCPAILGCEAGYRELRSDPLDYFEVQTAEEVLKCVRELKASPQLYQAMVARGRTRAQDFTADKVLRHWEEALAGPIRQAYERWQASPFRVRSVVRQYSAALRRRLWGYQAMQELPSSRAETLGVVRRALVLPRAAQCGLMPTRASKVVAPLQRSAVPE